MVLIFLRKVYCQIFSLSASGVLKKILLEILYTTGAGEGVKMSVTVFHSSGGSVHKILSPREKAFLGATLGTFGAFWEQLS